MQGLDIEIFFSIYLENKLWVSMVNMYFKEKYYYGIFHNSIFAFKIYMENLLEMIVTYPPPPKTPKHNANSTLKLIICFIKSRGKITILFQNYVKLKLNYLFVLRARVGNREGEDIGLFITLVLKVL